MSAEEEIAALQKDLGAAEAEIERLEKLVDEYRNDLNDRDNALKEIQGLIKYYV